MFGSVKKKEMIEILIKYKVALKMTNILARVYTSDETKIKIGEREIIKIGSRIKQGCSVSTVLFKLVTYQIRRELEENGEEFIGIVENKRMNSVKKIEVAKINLMIVK